MNVVKVFFLICSFYELIFLPHKSEKVSWLSVQTTHTEISREENLNTLIFRRHTWSEKISCQKGRKHLQPYCPQQHKGWNATPTVAIGSWKQTCKDWSWKHVLQFDKGGCGLASSHAWGTLLSLRSYKKFLKLWRQTWEKRNRGLFYKWC